MRRLSHSPGLSAALALAGLAVAGCGGGAYSMRETVSGEFVHAAPDNAESFGKENVSHGCIGMSTSDAKWLYGLSRKGDVVQVTGGPGIKPMDRFGNGYGDWNLGWAEWLEGSALGVRTG